MMLTNIFIGLRIDGQPIWVGLGTRRAVSEFVSCAERSFSYFVIFRCDIIIRKALAENVSILRISRFGLVFRIFELSLL